MKNCLKLFGIIAAVALIGLSMTACEGPTGPIGAGGRNSYLVIFNFNDGVTLPHVVGVRSGDTVSALPTPSSRAIGGDGTLFVFSGWYTDNETFENRWDFNTPVASNTMLHANWRDVSEFVGLVGTWRDDDPSWPTTVQITASTFTDVGMGYVGDILNIRSSEGTGTSGYITIRFTQVTPFGAVAPDPNHYDLGRFYVIHFQDLVANAIATSGAFLPGDPDFDMPGRIGGKATMEEAEEAYTLSAGAFYIHTTLARQP